MRYRWAGAAGAIDLSILVVNWNAGDLTSKCLESIRRTVPPRLAVETIVVDNGSTPDQLAVVRESARTIGASLVENQPNLGFARANNQAIAVARGRYLLLLNNDAEVADGALAALVAFMDGHPDVGIASARLVGPDDRVQFSHDLFPLTPWRLAYERVLDTLWPGNGRTRRSQLGRWGADPREPVEVDWVLGAAMIVRREAIEQVGPLDEGYFMYAEDLDWCYRVKKAGWWVLYVPQATVLHLGGGSTVRRPDLAPTLRRWRDRSLVRFYRRHYGWLAAAGMWLILFCKRARERPAGRRG